MQKITAIVSLLFMVALCSAWGITQHPTYPTASVGETVSYYTCIQNKGVGAKNLTATVSFNTEIATTEHTSYLILPGDEQVVLIQITPQEEGNKIIQARYTGRMDGNIETNYLINIPLTVIEGPAPDPCLGVTCPDYCSNGILYKDGVCYEGVCIYSTTACPGGNSGSTIYYPPSETTTDEDQEIEHNDIIETIGRIIRGEIGNEIGNETGNEGIDQNISEETQEEVIIIGNSTVIRADETKDRPNLLTFTILALFAIIPSIVLVLYATSDGREYLLALKEKIEDKIEEIRG